MSASNRERISKGLDLLRAGLAPFVERELQAEYGDEWLMEARQILRDESKLKVKDGQPQWDIHILLLITWDRWHPVFKKTLGHFERSLVSELRDIRNRWAHQEAFTTDDTYRAFDSIHRLLQAISAPEAREVDRMRQELLRVRYEEQVKKEAKLTAAATTAGEPQAGLKPWRAVVTPHPDVASGRYLQAEFMADLDVVFREPDRAASEYSDPREFFSRTYLTEGLKDLLGNALTRLAGKGGEPIVRLQTNFGGGKTHSLLALYHLTSGVLPSELPGVEEIMKTVEVDSLESVHRAVLVGTAISPGMVDRKPDGTEIRTIWGELAWQLGNSAGNPKEAYAIVAEADANRTSPGKALRELFTSYSPCLILIDEWVRYAGQLYKSYDLPGGSFETQFSFAQALTEAAKAVKNALLVVSIPASDIEMGGEGGVEATERLKNVVGRGESPWKPASAEESFEIVRRRLFQPITDPQHFKDRDAVVSAFATLYRTQAQDFPFETKEGRYKRRIESAYPIHPELFDRLYEDWSALDRFQRTRGVLRLLAKVIHVLWERQDANLLIMPGSIPMDHSQVHQELTRYMDENWTPVIDKDVDGPNALPLRLDNQNPTLGRYSACRRVARTIYLGSAPTLHAAHQGKEETRIKLGCVQPGESIATFGDALRRLTDDATYLYPEGKRYWYSPQPNINRTAKDRAAQQDIHDVWEECKRRVRAERERGNFTRVHAIPESSGDVPDDQEARLVILDPENTHAKDDPSSAAMKQAGEYIKQRGTSPRLYRNMLVFMASDRARLGELEQAIRMYLAWQSIVKEKETLNLDTYSSNQADAKKKQWDETVDSRLHETYSWLLVPSQPDPKKEMEWQAVRVPGQDVFAKRASRKLVNDGLLIASYSATALRIELDSKSLWKDVDHLGIKKLWEYLCQYIYLPRLKDHFVLLEAIQDGVAQVTWQENFAYAEAWDEEKQRYRGLKAGEVCTIHLDEHSVIVKPEVAQKQREAEEAERKPEEVGVGEKPGEAVPKPGEPEPTVPQLPKRFFGSVTIDPMRVSRDTGIISQEVIQHLTALVGSKVEVSMEIKADVSEGIPEDAQRTVSENCRTLKFEPFGFEKE